ncbi:MAG TPA: class E sortase [Acidimicrobiales bacterium]
MDGSTKKVVVAVLAGLLVAVGGGVWYGRPVHAGQSAGDDPQPVHSQRVHLTIPPSAPTTSTTLSAEERAFPQPARPIDVPDDPYAPEAVVKIGTIQIPKIGLVADIYQGVTLRNIDNGPSHWPGTALPGEPGNAVLAGHRVTHTHPFRDIDQLVPGDKVIFTVAGVVSTYVVTGHEVVDPSDMAVVAQTPTATATLFACHPPHYATYRYVVHLAAQT